MNRSTTARSLALPSAAIVLAVVAVLALVANGAFGRSPAPADPGASPSPVPSAPATPKPTTPPAQEPSDDPFAPIDLEHPGGVDIDAVIQDATGRVVAGRSGSPVSGMSVRWFDLQVENVDADTLRLTWVGLPIDEYHKVRINQVGDALQIVVLMPLPPENSDALGQDLILELDFDGPIDADAVATDVQSLFDD